MKSRPPTERERKRKPQRPSTSAPRRPKNRQVVEDTSEEEAGADLPPYPLMDYEGAGEGEPTENPNRLTDWPLHTQLN